MQRLLEMVSPDLYRSNAFRVTGLPVTASMQEIKQQQARLKMISRLGAEAGRPTCGYLPLDPPPDEEAIRKAVTRLQDPEIRLLDEIFWFRQSESGSEQDQGLSLLRQNRVDEALQHWSKAQKASGDDQASLHTLAVLCHAVALDLEHLSAQRSLDQKEMLTRDNAWTRCYCCWHRLIDEDAFWQLMSARVRELDDPRLTSETIQAICQALPQMILLVNARMAVAAAERVDMETASRHKTLMQTSHFDSELIAQSMTEALQPVFERVKALCKQVEKSDAPPVEQGKNASELLRQCTHLLRAVDMLLPPGHAERDTAFDGVAAAALESVLAYGCATEDWSLCIDLLERIREISVTQSMRDRIEENLKAAHRNREGDRCCFCGKGEPDKEKAVQVPIYKVVDRVEDSGGVHVRYRTATISVPRCPACSNQHRLLVSHEKRAMIICIALGAFFWPFATWLGAACAHFRYKAEDWVVFAMTAICGAAVGYWAGDRVVRAMQARAKKRLPASVKPPSGAVDYCVVQQLISEDWNIGTGPSG